MNERSRFDAITSWNHVLELIGESESVHLECKTKQNATTPKIDPSDRDNIAMPASAFANGGGGILIFGLTTKDPVTKLQSREITGVQSIVKVKEFADRIENELKRTVDPLLGGCDVRPIENGTESGVVLIHVPESLGGPHRVTTACSSEVGDRYYMRTSTSTVNMPHSALADRFARNAQPKLRLVVTYDGTSSAAPLAITIRLWNDGRGAARNAAVLLDASPRDFDFFAGHQNARLLPSGWHARRTNSEAGVSRILFEAPIGTVIYPGTDSVVTNWTNNGNKAIAQFADADFVFQGQLFALNVQPKSFTGTLRTGSQAITRVDVP